MSKEFDSEAAWPHLNEQEDYDGAVEPLLEGDSAVEQPAATFKYTHMRLIAAFTLPALLLVFALYRAIAVIASPSGMLVTSSSRSSTTSTFVPTKYEVVQGVFAQSETTYTGNTYDMLNDSFGLIDKSPNRWRNLITQINMLNANSDGLTAYKLFYVARHGEGYHNVGEAKYGTAEWDCHWSMLNGDGDIVWGPDPHLTPKGERQASTVNAAWKRQIEDDVPLPQMMYSSPLRRSSDTLQITWSDILLDKGFQPIIKENWRESIGLHTCDKRSTKSIIAAEHPRWRFEDTFTEQDELWTATYQETNPQQAIRTHHILNELFATDPAAFIGITAHSGTITAFFTVVGHHNFGVGTGGFVPILVKATGHRNESQAIITGGQSATAPVCAATAHSAAI